MIDNETTYEVPVETEEAPESTPDYVKITLESSVAPLELRFSQINSCRKKSPIAYRTFTNINSVIEGVIPPEKYAYAADETDRGVRLTKWNISAAANALKSFAEAGRHVEFLSVRVSPQIVREVDVYSYLKNLLSECGIEDPEKLCLEFPRTVFYEETEKVRSALLAMKLLKVKSMLSGCGDHDCPFSPLFSLPFDYLLLSPAITQLTDDRNKHEGAEALLMFFKSLKCELIADGLQNDDQIIALDRADAYGYIPDADYVGRVEHGELRMPIEDALPQREEVDDF